MPEALGLAFEQVWALSGLVWLTLAIGLAGLIRGFTGFGTALIFVPVAGIFLEPVYVVAVMAVTGVISTSALLPRAWGQADLKQVGILAAAALITIPIGLTMMAVTDREVIRWCVAGIAMVTLISLVGGWRYDRVLGPVGLMSIGGLAGAVGGMTGLTGPVVIMFYLTGRGAARSVRANTIVFLAALDLFLVGNLTVRGEITLEILVLALMLAVPYFITTLIGQSLFDPSREKLYRWAAYAVIGLAVVTGLPVWT